MSLRYKLRRCLPGGNGRTVIQVDVLRIKPKILEQGVAKSRCTPGELETGELEARHGGRGKLLSSW